jgi:hypothetical protein
VVETAPGQVVDRVTDLAVRDVIVEDDDASRREMRQPGLAVLDHGIVGMPPVDV